MPLQGYNRIFEKLFLSNCRNVLAFLCPHKLNIILFCLRSTCTLHRLVFTTLYMHMYVCISVFDTCKFCGATLAYYLALHSSLFGPDNVVNYDYIVTKSINSINWLKIYSQ